MGDPAGRFKLRRRILPLVAVQKASVTVGDCARGRGSWGRRGLRVHSSADPWKGNVVKAPVKTGEVQ